jgi:hypothetical protein
MMTENEQRTFTVEELEERLRTGALVDKRDRVWWHDERGPVNGSVGGYLRHCGRLDELRRLAARCDNERFERIERLPCGARRPRPRERERNGPVAGDLRRRAGHEHARDRGRVALVGARKCFREADELERSR